MRDGLTDEERSLAFLAGWHPSFTGAAIVNPDFTFRAVNPQFCELLNVTPAEIMNQHFDELTPAKVRDLNRQNAELVKEGKITSYLIKNAACEFPSGEWVDVAVLVNGVYHPETKDFMFFVLTIMERQCDSQSAYLFQRPTGWFALIDKKKLVAVLGAAIATAMIFVLEWALT